MTQPLSPAAQAVLDAFSLHPIRSDHIASDLLHGALPAALQALARLGAFFPDEVEAIAAELEGGR